MYVKVKYIGYIFGVDGVSADPDKVKAVLDIPSPTTRKQVKSFLGFAGFYRRFMPPDYASIIQPLTELTKPSVPFHWDVKCQRAFDRVKLLMTSPLSSCTRISVYRSMCIVTPRVRGSGQCSRNISMGPTAPWPFVQRGYYHTSRTGHRPNSKPLQCTMRCVLNGGITLVLIRLSCIPTIETSRGYLTMPTKA